MAFLQYSASEKRLDKWRAEERGTGTGADYIAYLQEFDVKARTANVFRFTCGLTGRPVALFGDFHLAVWLALEFSGKYESIEQYFPVDRELTRRLAKKLNVQHPVDGKNAVDLVLISTFRVRLKQAPPASPSYQHIFLFAESELDSFGNAIHLELWRRAWRELDVPVRVGSDHPGCLSAEFRDNLSLLNPHRLPPTEPPYEGYYEWLDTSVLKAVLASRSDKTLSAAASDLDAKLSVKPGESINAIWRLLWNRRLRADMGVPLKNQSVKSIALRSKHHEA